ncbi:MAG: spore cortex biosynthesis protein YabQ [Clostridia bacterium]|nr:spore cortex biosynthesis protein YabQ [Clostridia bacterium]
MTLQVQFQTMYMMLMSGLSMGIIFDTYRVVCSQLKIYRWVVSVVDILYWIASTALVFYALYTSNQGQVRLYVFIGLFVGIWVYFFIFSSVIIRFVVWLIQKIKQLLRLLYRIFEITVLKPVFLLYRLVVILLGFLAAVAMFIWKIVLQLFRPMGLGIARLFRVLYRKWSVPRRIGQSGKRFVQWIKRLF